MGLSRSKKLTLDLVKSYLRERRSYCFTYEELRRFYVRSKWYNRLNWHTCERNIRHLVSEGILRRVVRSNGGRRTVLFCIKH